MEPTSATKGQDTGGNGAITEQAAEPPPPTTSSKTTALIHDNGDETSAGTCHKTFTVHPSRGPPGMPFYLPFRGIAGSISISFNLLPSSFDHSTLVCLFFSFPTFVIHTSPFRNHK